MQKLNLTGCENKSHYYNKLKLICKCFSYNDKMTSELRYSTQ